jgi:hypothetical protein
MYHHQILHYNKKSHNTTIVMIFGQSPALYSILAAGVASGTSPQNHVYVRLIF